MTEQEWNVCTDAKPMLEYVRGKFSERKLRLAACGCARHIQKMQKDGSGADIVSAAEQYAEQTTGGPDLLAPTQLAEHMLQHAPLSRTRFGAKMIDATTAPDAWFALRETMRWAACLVDDRRVLFDCVRDVLGNPACRVVLDPCWVTCNVVGVARAVYDQRGFDRMPILADALEDAGCTNADILTHCRQPGEHVRGCWALDLVLEKE